ncbi:hypothetical protein [Pseudomonas sp. Sample_10]|uniref:hypothetical protein n=1 Tax=Pseudomonas sp. Sample_10 TaxID=2448269 RepID=UPI0010363702|nr:hypothetical protein [Pseudomonas sp. Sample_10]
MTESKFRFWDTIIKALGFFGITLTIAFSAYQHLSNQEKEYKNPFWSEQLKTCIAAANISAKIAASSETWIPSKDIDKLFNIYFGRGALTLNSSSLEKLRVIGNRAVRCNAKTETPESCTRFTFNSLAFEVSETCRETLATSWELPLQKLGKKSLEIETPD